MAIPVTPAGAAGAGGEASPPPVPRFHVQVAAFPARQDAVALALRLTSMGYAATVVDGPPYRVWVGGYLDQATAERLAQHLRGAGFEATLTPN